jgi:hypothetical protein
MIFYIKNLQIILIKNSKNSLNLPDFLHMVQLHSQKYTRIFSYFSIAEFS